jgi:hypothetical protein
MIPPNVKNLRAVVGKSWMCLSLEGNSTSPLLAGVSDEPASALVVAGCCDSLL